MPRCTRSLARLHPTTVGDVSDDAEAIQLGSFWQKLSLQQRKQLLRVDKRALFQTIRAQYCSRCFGLFVLRFEELKGSAPVECQACATFYVGLVVENGQTLTLEESILEDHPFKNFADAKARERERELQFMSGGICGNGWTRSAGNTMCNLHTSSVRPLSRCDVEGWMLCNNVQWRTIFFSDHKRWKLSQDGNFCRGALLITYENAGFPLCQVVKAQACLFVLPFFSIGTSAIT